jgi:hypothetical protein
MEPALRKKLIVVLLVKKFLVIDGTQLFIILFTRFRHWTMSNVR